jgi:hypothetical protein
MVWTFGEFSHLGVWEFGTFGTFEREYRLEFWKRQEGWQVL